MAYQLDMQRDDYADAIKKGKVSMCEKCTALSIVTCADVKRGICFYCGSKDVSFDKDKVEKAFKARIKEGAL